MNPLGYVARILLILAGAFTGFAVVSFASMGYRETALLLLVTIDDTCVHDSLRIHDRRNEIVALIAMVVLRVFFDGARPATKFATVGVAARV
jgi:hypothetical protein